MSTVEAGVFGDNLGIGSPRHLILEVSYFFTTSLVRVRGI